MLFHQRFCGCFLRFIESINFFNKVMLTFSKNFYLGRFDSLILRILMLILQLFSTLPRISHVKSTVEPSQKNPPIHSTELHILPFSKGKIIFNSVWYRLVYPFQRKLTAGSPSASGEAPPPCRFFKPPN